MVQLEFVLRKRVTQEPSATEAKQIREYAKRTQRKILEKSRGNKIITRL